MGLAFVIGNPNQIHAPKPIWPMSLQFHSDSNAFTETQPVLAIFAFS